MYWYPAACFSARRLGFSSCIFGLAPLVWVGLTLGRQTGGDDGSRRGTCAQRLDVATKNRTRAVRALSYDPDRVGLDITST
jgi:hypothetical protein